MIGACAVVAGKRIASNTAWAGNPAQQVKRGVFFAKELTCPWTAEEADRHSVAQTRDGIYQHTEQVKAMREIDARLKGARSTAEKLRVLQEALVADQSKDRFYVAEPTTGLFGRRRRAPR